MTTSNSLQVVACALLLATGNALAITVDTQFDLPVDTCDDPVLCTGNGNGVDGDVGDLPGRDGKITFREAIIAANQTRGTQSIDFATAAGTVTILRRRALPPYRDSNGSIIGNGHTFKGNALSAASPNTPVSGLEIAGNGNRIEGLVFNQFPNIFPGPGGIGGNGSAGMIITGNGNTVTKCLSGTDAAGSIAIPNGIGITVFGDDNRIGPGNTFSGNLWHGVGLEGDGNKVFGNHIGDSPFNRVFGNGDGGVAIWGNRNLVGASSFFRIGPRVVTFGDPNEIVGNGTNSTPAGLYLAVNIMGGVNNTVVQNRIGTDAQGNPVPNVGGGVLIQMGGARNTIVNNVVSGNTYDGVVVDNSSNNLIEGNRIGTNAAGAAAIPNTETGLVIDDNARGNKVIDNVISGNGHDGVSIVNAHRNELRGNSIGLNLRADDDIPNQESGIEMTHGASGNVIGGAGPIAGFFGYTFFSRSRANFISANQHSGVYITDAGTESNEVTANRIGTDRAGTADFGNGNNGVHISNGAKRNKILDNLVSGNQRNGVRIRGAGTDLNRLEKNVIGLDINGVALKNERDGVHIIGGARKNYIGDLTANAGNVISGNDGEGIDIRSSDETQIFGNRIGLNPAGDAERPNGGSGIWNRAGSDKTEIGSFAALSQNTISGNDVDGIHITDSDDVKILNARIGTNQAGRAAIKNDYNGVHVDDGSERTAIGEVGGGNIVSGNGRYGVLIEDTTVKKTSVIANVIGLGARGRRIVPNERDGVRVKAAEATTIGGAGRRGNTIAGNKRNGIHIRDDAKSTRVFGNYIGLDGRGRTARANEQSGVYVSDAAKDVAVGLGTISGNWIAGNTQWGVRIGGAGTQNVRVADNRIGLNVNNVGVANGEDGVLVEDGAEDINIGLTNDGNVIGSNTKAGIRVRNAGTRSVAVLNNSIGIAAGNPRANALGISVEDGATQVEIGRLGAGNPNTIAYNTGHGVQIIGAASDNNPIRGNWILKNGGRGIELDGGGIDGIDLADADTGANETMNGPVLCLGTDRSTGRRFITGHLEHPAAATARVDLYHNAQLDADGFGEGHAFMLSVTPDAAGWISVPNIRHTPLFVARNLTATATDANGNTSEFVPVLTMNMTSSATLVPDKVGNRNINHYVLPRQTAPAGAVIDMRYTVTPATNAVRNQLGWANATVDPADPTHATIARNVAAEHQVQVQFFGQPCHEDRAWVVWSTVTGTRDLISATNTTNTELLRILAVQTPAGTAGEGRAVQSWWSFRSTIAPTTIVTAAHRPNFNLAPVSAVPNQSQPHFNDGGTIGGAPLRWDMTRQVRLRILSPQAGTNDIQQAPGIVYQGLPNPNKVVTASVNQGSNGYPVDRLEGNDNSPDRVKDSNPYDAAPAVGVLTDRDRPRFPVIANRGFNTGDTIEIRTHFHEFTRLEIGGTWHRISDDYEWRFHSRLRHNGTTWVDNGSVSDTTNNGW